MMGGSIGKMGGQNDRADTSAASIANLLLLTECVVGELNEVGPDLAGRSG